MKLEHRMSARRDFRLYALLLVGLVFAWAGATVDPARNCDESGRECAPWLVPVAFCLGVAAASGALAALLGNARWGSRLDLRERRLWWWDTRTSAATHAVALDDVARIKVRIVDEGSDKLFFYDRGGALMPIPAEEVFPHPCETWARELAACFPHLAVEVERG